MVTPTPLSDSATALDFNRKEPAKTFLPLALERLHKLAVWIFSHFVVFTRRCLNRCFKDDEILAFQAVYKGEVTLLRALAEIGVDIKAKTSLVDAMQSKKNAEQTIAILIEHGAELDFQEKSTGNTALHYAATKSNLAAWEILIEKGASLSILNKDGETPLDIANKDSQGSEEEEETREKDAATIQREMTIFLNERAYETSS